jgi:putative addiction module component (TIGR02574 family)
MYEPDVESAWSEEIKRRLAEIDGGMVTLIPWEEVRAELFGSIATEGLSQP